MLHIFYRNNNLYSAINKNSFELILLLILEHQINTIEHIIEPF